MSREFVLAIETGIAGGSLSILKNGSEIDFWKGLDKISRSEDLLLNISNLLSKNSLSKKEIKKIAVSIGPGSFTGVRVGIAIAKGLQKALKCECKGVSALESMVLKTENSGIVATGFAIGKNEACWQIFETDGTGEIQSIDVPKITLIKDFAANLKNLKANELIFNSDLYEKILEFGKDNIPSNLKLIELVENPSKYVGLRSVQIFPTNPTTEILPIYAREARTS
jgi:tRNA threonylcarbamoyl adenosine modification protein YeaZ